MMNLIVFIMCTLATILQWNNNWWLVGLNGVLAVLNLLFGIQWVVKCVRNRKVKW